MIKIEVNKQKTPWVIGIGTIVFGIVLAVLLALYSNVSGPAKTVSYLVIGLIIASGIWLYFEGKNRKLTIEDDLICCSNRFGRKKTFRLEDIAYCRAALEIKKGNRNYLKLYNEQDAELCKLEFDMGNIYLFLQYLLDNNVRIECTENTEMFLQIIINMAEISKEEINVKVNSAYKEAEQAVYKWSQKNESFGAEWKLGLAEYLDDEFEEDVPLWQQKGYVDKQEQQQKGYFIMLEGYLQKNGVFVLDKENQPVSFSVQLLYVSQALRKDGGLKICFSNKALEYMSEQLLYYEKILPENKYYTEMIVLHHELKESINDD